MLKQKFKTLSLRLLLAIVAIMALPDVANAATIEKETKFYLKPGTNWLQADARFAIYFYGNGETWVSMTDSDGDGTYEGTSPTDKTYTNLIFCRMNPAYTDNNWDNKWDQTNNLEYDGTNNLYTVANDAWSKGGGSWSEYITGNITGNITEGITFYLKPGTNWKTDNARFAIYFFGNGDTWVSMTDSDGDGIYEGTTPAGSSYTNLIFCRMNPAYTDNNWDNKWDQTNNLEYDGTKNMYTVADGAWSYGDGSWSVYTPTKQLTRVALTGLDGVSVGDATISGDVYTWSFTYSGEELVATVNVNETYDDNSVENATEVKTETFYNGSDYVITYNVETNELTITPTHKLLSVKCSLFENVASIAPYSWTYNHTKATETGVTLTFTENWTNGSTDYPLEGVTFAEGSAYSITYDAANHKGAVVSEPKPVITEVKIIGHISSYNVWDGTNGDVITDENGDGIYEYSYTHSNDNLNSGNDPYFAYYVTYSDGTHKYFYGVDNTANDLSESAQNYTENDEVYEDSPTFHYPFVLNGIYTVVLNTNTQTVSVQIVSEPAPANITILGYQGGLNDSWDTGIEMTYIGNNLFTYTLPEGKTDIYFIFNIDGTLYDGPGDSSGALKLVENEWSSIEVKGSSQRNELQLVESETSYIYTIYLNYANKTVTYKIDVPEGYKSGIPVYPLGVSNETELAAYDFDANPVYYLCSPVLNDNRISPEWQMVKEADGKFWIRGFAMRNTNARDNGDYLEEGNIKVVQFTSVAQEEGDEVYSEPYNETGDKNPWSEGRLYNACYDPATSELTLTNVVDRMPFISMVGYNFQQLENYTTPRNSTTSRGWQEAWILYDENGEVVKDRNGKVLYSTMWPPKNPVYFNAVKGGESIELSSNNLTFSAVEDYAVKTGAAWEAELTDDAYANLSLGSDTEYIRYKIDYMWILGATKIWTGWGGQSASWGSQWDNHMNWGYGSDTGNESGAVIESQESYALAQNAGNFLVAEPTYYQTVEFFYNVAEPVSSVFYTTLAHGNPSIRAKATEDYHGNYDIEVKDADGLAITAYTVTRYNAVTNVVDTANGDNGAVKNETGDWTADTFNDETWVDDKKELADGKYYYELKITIDGEDVTVYSNPFTIYRPADHQTEVKVMQLLELETPVNGAKYITVPVTSEGQLDETADLWYVTVDANDAVTAVTAVSDPASAREMIKTNMTAYDWTMKALITSEKPASWTTEMEDTAAETMQDGDVTNWNLTINGTEVIKVAPNANDNMLYIYDHGVPSTNSYKATMDYSYTLNGVAGVKATIGKETALTLEVPQAVAQAQELKVVHGDDAEITGDVIPQNGDNEKLKLQVAEQFVDPYYQPMDNDANKAEPEIEETNVESAKIYEQVNVTFNFTMPAISEEVYNKCVVAYMPKLTAYKDGTIVEEKYLSLVKDTEFGEATKSITVTGINPSWDKVVLSIATQYYDTNDMSSFVEGRFGEAPVMEQAVSFSANEILSVSGEAWQYERMVRKKQEGFHYEGTGTFDLGVSNVTASFSSGNATISEIDVEAPAYYNLGVVYNANSFASPYVFDGEGHDLGVLWAELAVAPTGSVTLEVRPLYFFETISGMELSSTGLAEFDPAATPATASTTDTRTFVALYGNTNSLEISNIQTSVEDAVMSGAVVKAGQGYIEVVGAEKSSVYSVSGAMVGNGESRYDVVPGVYVVIADGKAVKVVVR